MPNKTNDPQQPEQPNYTQHPSKGVTEMPPSPTSAPYWLRSPDGERCIASLARGAVRERMLFNRLAEGEIALPPYPAQLVASRALAEIRPLKKRLEAQLREIELLPARLLAQTFGEV